MTSRPFMKTWPVKAYLLHSINSFVYRGHTPHRLRIPRLFQPLSPFKGGEWIANGPPTLSLGEFSKISPWNLTFQIAAGNYSLLPESFVI